MKRLYHIKAGHQPALPSFLAVVGLLIVFFLLMVVTGCKLDPNSSHVTKTTVLGLDVSPGGSGPGTPYFRLGLVRYQHVSNPAGATLVSHVDAHLGFKQQDAIEDLSIGPGTTVQVVTNVTRIAPPPIPGRRPTAMDPNQR